MGPFDGGLGTAGNTYTPRAAGPYRTSIVVYGAQGVAHFPCWFSCRNTLYINKHHTLAVTLQPIASLSASNKTMNDMCVCKV